MVYDEELRIVERLLLEKKNQLTGVRRLIVQFFLKHLEHYKPEEVYQHLKAEHLSVASVYRSLEILKSIGFIRALSVGSTIYYELNMFSSRKLHTHFYCYKCRSLFDYNDDSIRQQMLENSKMLEDKYGDDVHHFDSVLKGICKSCKAVERF